MSKAPHAKLLVVDDEPQIRRLLRAALERSGYEVVVAEDARQALSLLGIERPDLVLLDLGLPDRDGLELLPLIRARSQAKVLVVSAREAIEEKVAALDLGADDFVTKPFDTDELLARVRVALRQRLAAAAPSPVARLGAVEVDLLGRQVRREGVEVHLTPKEWGLLAELARHPGRVITHGQLLRAVWGPAHEHDVEYLRVAVRSLRAKLEENPATPTLILNEPGVGYRLASETP
jgi:two-component system KDP operon response regulator KdpE